MNFNATLIIQTVSFILLGLFTMKFIWPPLMTAIEQRQRKIAEGLAAADKGEKSLEEARAAASEVIKDARVQATKIVDQANRRSNDLVDEARGAAIAEGQRLVSEARQEVSLESSRAREQLRKEVVSLAVVGASRLLNKEIDARVHAELLDQLAGEIERGS